jgi:methyl coenzyme M reductase alpha subunit
MGVPPKPPGLIVFKGLFVLYNKSGRLLPDPLKTSFQNILSVKISASQVWLGSYTPSHPISSYICIAYGHILDKRINTYFNRL